MCQEETERGEKKEEGQIAKASEVAISIQQGSSIDYILFPFGWNIIKSDTTNNKYKIVKNCVKQHDDDAC